MSPKFPDINSNQILKVVTNLGFIHVRTTGSHAIYRRPSDNRRTTIPMHGKKSLKRKTIKAICKDIDITLK